MDWRQGLAPALSGLALLFFVGATLAADHRQCQSCHDPGTPTASNLRQPLSALCSNCHLGRISAGEHAVDIPVKVLSASLPLQTGIMTCVTCHDPHAPGVALRMKDPELCEACHH